MKKLKQTKTIHRVSAATNPVDQIKMKAMQQKLKKYRNQSYNLKRRLAVLANWIADRQQKMAGLPDAVLEKVSTNEKIVIEEIISAARKSHPKGRRYSEDFMMLCMLMNIRSRSYYEYLRRHQILPLPCSKTVRDWMSLVGNKCGFDENFFELLKKSFEIKNERQRHGVLLVDEINLRKSVGVSARDLTYTGLTDFGDDGPKGTDINDVATHGLVLMFQSMTEKYTQPIAVFASKTPVAGDDLSKLVVKGICLLENSGAIVHGVIRDGASTNRKMWKLLKIDSSVDGLRNYF